MYLYNSHTLALSSMNEESRTVQLTGGSPWGLRIQGGADFRAPLKVTKVSPGGKAALAGVQVSDVIKRIGDTDCSGLRHSEALFLIRTSGDSLSLVLQKGGSVPAPYQAPKLQVAFTAKPSSPAKKPASVESSPMKISAPAISNPSSPDKNPALPAEEPVPAVDKPDSPANPEPVEKKASPAKAPESTGFARESAGGKDWYLAMHRLPQTTHEVPRHFTYAKEEKEAPKPQPIKPKPRTFQVAAPVSSSPPPYPKSSPPPSPSLQSATCATPDTLSATPPPDTSQPTNGTASNYVSSPDQSNASPHSPEYAVPADQPSPAQESADSKAPNIETGKKRGGKRKLKPPPADWARGLYDFVAETKHELSFKKGAKLRLLRTVDENWLEAQLGGVKGIIPVSYVDLCHSPPAPDTPSPAGPHARALYDFAAEEGYELAFQKGQLVALLSQVDENWLQGRVGARTGIFPAAFVQVLVPLSEPAQEQLIENEIRTRGPAQPAVQQGEMFRAVYAYAPQNSDELALSPGTDVMVVRKCEDGWFMGYSEETGAFGTFPGNYVEPIP